jgi:hypothetical protein
LSTPFAKIYPKFFDKVEKDTEFFNYYNLTEAESMAIAIERSKSYLLESVNDLVLKCTPDIDFTDYDETLEEFNSDLTKVEIGILASLMFEKYVSRDIAKLKTFDVNFTPSDLKVFDPSNSRKSFMEMYLQLQSENEKAIDNYISKDRLTGKKRGIKYSSYEEY